MPEARVIVGDCVAAMQSMPENSVDAVVTDPPAGIAFMSKEWDKDKGGRTAWVEWLTEVMQEALRVVKPGGHAFVWALPRTSHWAAWAIEDAGWQIREVCHHIFGSGFPKSRNLGNGWGTALKPAVENWILCRAPLSEKSVAANFDRHGTGAINVDASRVGPISRPNLPGPNGGMGGNAWRNAEDREDRMPVQYKPSPQGRWPANLLLSHSEQCERRGVKRVKTSSHSQGRAAGKSMERQNLNNVYSPFAESACTQHVDQNGFEETEDWACVEGCPVRLLDEQSGVSKSSGGRTANISKTSRIYNRGKGLGQDLTADEVRGDPGFGDKGGASRFFKVIAEEECCPAARLSVGNPAVADRPSGPSLGQHTNDTTLHEPDTGAGFYYVAKASRGERNKGLEGMPEKETAACYEQGNGLSGRTQVDGEWVNTDNPRKPKANNHPTVKPIALMRYLVKMVCPPGGTVLDPFMGSGSTGCAAILEGFDFIGIEQDEEYAEIAEKRIAFWSLPEEEREKASGKQSRARNTYGFKTTDVLRRCPEHGESIPSGVNAYKCGCMLVYRKLEQAEETLFA